MDWTLAIERNREALKRILAMLVAMVEAASGADARAGSPATLPRHLRRFVLRLLRPAEAAARRLIIVAARGLVVTLAPPRPRDAKPKPILNRSNGFGTGIVIRPGPLPEWARALAPKRSPTVSLPLFDPLKRFGSRRRYVKPSAVPHIRSFDDPRVPFFRQPRAPVPLRPSPDDLLDAGRLNRRLKAMASALDDLPHHAKRLARWQARRDAASARPVEHRDAVGVQRKVRFQRLSPMRPGRPPGWSRRPSHQVYEVLDELHGLAVWAMARPDTS